MTVLAAIRPDSWNLVLLLHILGAMVLVGALLLAVTALIASRGANGAAMRELAYRSLLFVALPAWLVMRIAAESIASKEGYSDLDKPPAWIDHGYEVAEPTFLLLIIATVLAGLGVRRAARDGGESPGRDRVATVLIALALLAYLFAIWAMTTKPV